MRRLIALFTILVLASPLVAQGRGPSTAEERDTAVKLARLLENDPLGPQAKDARQWLTVWLIAVPDITVSLCSSLLGSVPRSARKYESELVVQTMYSGAAFIIQNRDKASDRVAVYQAGVEGALKAYESIRKREPKFSWPFLDDLIARRDRGDLAGYVADAAAKCAK